VAYCIVRAHQFFKVQKIIFRNGPDGYPQAIRKTFYASPTITPAVGIETFNARGAGTKTFRAKSETSDTNKKITLSHK
jgi:hypothetical protein